MAIAFSTHYGPAAITTTTPKTASPTVAVGDVLVVGGWQETNLLQIATPSGGGYTYTASVTKIGSAEGLQSWVSLINSAQSFTLTDSTSGTARWAFDVYRFTGVSGSGATTSGTSASGAPTMSITTTVAHSAIVVLLSRHDGSGNSVALTYITSGAGTFTEVTNQLDSFRDQFYMGYYLDSGTVGTKSIGASNTGLSWTGIAIELVPPVAGGLTPPSLIVNKALRRSTIY